jgi:uncharacterized membrane protein
MTAPAIVSWAAYVGWLDVSNGPIWFVGTVPMVVLLTALALFELIMDKTAKLGARTDAGGLTFRIVTSSFSGGVVYSAVGASLAPGIVAGLVGGMIGTYGGYYLRRTIVQNSSFGDPPIAIAEDIIAIGLGLVCVYLPGH